MNGIWIGMMFISIVYAMISGNMQSLSSEILNSSKEAVHLCIYMAGIVGMWTGMMKAAEKIGLLHQVEKALFPCIHFLFPKLKDRETKEYIAVNMASNLLGLGWAATPSGLKAMKCLQNINCRKERASEEMCTLLIINISSLQLIPINMIAYREQFGSSDPAAVILPAILATSVSTLTGILFCKIMQR